MLPSLTGITGTQFSVGHNPSSNSLDYLRPSRLDFYLEPDQRANVAKPRFANAQHANDSESSVKALPQSKRFPYGDNYTHFPNI
jgi:hypothetical protein